MNILINNYKNIRNEQIDIEIIGTNIFATI